MNLTPAQQAVVDHGSGPCRLSGGFGTGKSAALAARADRLRAAGQQPLLLHHRDFVGFAVGLLRRHGRSARLLGEAEQRAVVVTLLAETGPSAWPSLEPSTLGNPAFVDEVVATLLAYQASFLGDEELRVHTDAAGELDRWEDFAAFAGRYLAVLGAGGRVDAAGALVAASMAMRDPAVAAAERARFDHLLIDDYQLADFAVSRLVAQLAGPGGNVTAAGNPEAAVGESWGASEQYFEGFARRFGAVLDVDLDVGFRHPGVPTLRLVAGPDHEAAAVSEAWADGETQGLTPADMTTVPRDGVVAAVGREWALVVVPGVTEGSWPRPYRPARWFDLELLRGPDVPDDEVRRDRWAVLERRRFAVACSRATRWLVVTAAPPVSSLVGELVR